LPAAAQERGWVERSNEFTQQVLAMQAAFQPEGASQSGLEQYDGLALDLGPNLPRTLRRGQKRSNSPTCAPHSPRKGDPNVKQDIEILISSLERDIEGTRLGQRLTLDWYGRAAAGVFNNLNGLLDDQMAPARRAKAVELFAALHRTLRRHDAP
jgi:hypothetical protein